MLYSPTMNIKCRLERSLRVRTEEIRVLASALRVQKSLLDLASSPETASSLIYDGCRIMTGLISKMLSPSPISVSEFYDVFVRLWTGLAVKGQLRKQARISRYIPPFFCFVEPSDCL